MRALKMFAAAAVAAASVGIAATAVAQTYPPFEDPILNPDSLDHLKCYPVRVLDAANPQYLDGMFPVDLLNQFQLERNCRVFTPPRFFCAETAKFRIDNPEQGTDDPRGGRAGDFACFDVQCPPEEIEPTKQPDGTGTIPEGFYRDQFSVGRVNYRIARKNPRLVCAPVEKLRPEPPIGFPPNNPEQPQ